MISILYHRPWSADRQLAGDIPAQVVISRLPQRLPTAQRVGKQSRMGDKHVHGARSRFLTKAVMACLEEVAYGESERAEAPRAAARDVGLARRQAPW